MKTKCKIISKSDALKWYSISNLFIKSLCPFNVSLRQYNKLSYSDKRQIQRLFSQCDETRRKRIPKGESDETWIISVMVDSNIIATEFDIDPLTAAMCVKPPCNINYRIIVK